jgi:class 3 adenylate cyclase
LLRRAYRQSRYFRSHSVVAIMGEAKSEHSALEPTALLREGWLSFAEVVLVFFWPGRLFDGYPWRGIWEAKERLLVTVMSQAWLVLAAMAYIAHYFLFDRVQQLQPSYFWLYFRLGMACLLLGTALFYASPLIHRMGRFYRIPSALAMWLMAYTQALVTHWYSVDAWAFCFVFMLVSLLILRMNVLSSVGYIALIVTSIWMPLQQVGLPKSYLISGVVVSLAIMIAFKTAHLYGIHRFLQEQERLRQQREVIELRMLIADQIRMLIPKVIAKRIERLVAEVGLGVRSALRQALRPQQKQVVCLHTDIRGYTRAVESSDEYLRQAVIPEITAMHQVIDDLDGVPRKIGDLMFAYFDEADQQKNALTGFLAAINLSLISQTVNQSTVLPTIRRYFLLVSGPAWVGNMGGLDSSVEITALGSPVNLAARLDELTKQPKFLDVVQIGDIVMPEEMHALLLAQIPNLAATAVNLSDLSLEIRDFPQVRHLKVIRPSQDMADQMLAHHSGRLL